MDFRPSRATVLYELWLCDGLTTIFPTGSAANKPTPQVHLPCCTFRLRYLTHRLSTLLTAMLIRGPWDAIRFGRTEPQIANPARVLSNQGFDSLNFSY
jgi:hypothetical protein